MTHSSGINYTHLIHELSNAQAFDLYRLNVAINKELNNPKRTLAIRKRLRLGMELTYFNDVENRLIPCKVLKINQKNVLIEELESNRPYLMPYYMLNINATDITIHETNTGGSLTANNVQVGDWVGFDKEGESIFGVIKRINSKTVTLETNKAQRWRVSYACLYRVHDAEITLKPLPHHT